ncbi:MAG TPA: hypothetical protein VEL47_08005 [Myxococcota bacterium]|nr:hypothetical protein [Myxococcota bacterium]
MRLFCGVLILQFVVAVGCTYKDDMAETGAFALKKEQLRGEWYGRATVMDKHAHSAFAFSGLECPVERVTFAITKDQLLAYRSHSNDPSHQRDGLEKHLVAAFRIISHLDGEEIRQPRKWSRRPWHERDFIVVDWSRNLAPHLECNLWLDAITDIHINSGESIDATEPMRLRIEKDYVETTVDALVAPDVATCKKIEERNCMAAEYRVKFSFSKVSPHNDYEKMHYPDAEPIRFGTNEEGICLEHETGCENVRELRVYADAMTTEECDPLRHNIENCFQPTIKMNSSFGYFRTDVIPYDRKVGFAKANREQLINRWNLWQKSMNDSGEPLPLKDRKPKKIVYYLSPGFPERLLPAVKRVEKEWNTAFANVVAKIKNQCTVKNALMAQEQPALSNELKTRGIHHIDEINLKEACNAIYQATKNLLPEEIFFTGAPDEIEQAFGQIFEIKNNDCHIERVLAHVERNNLAALLSEYDISSITEDNVEKACAVLEWASKKLGYEPFSWQRLGDLRHSFVNLVKKPDGDLLGYGPASVDPKTGEIISGNANIYLASILQYASRSAKVLAHLEKANSSEAKNLAIKAEDESADAIAKFSAIVGRSISGMATSSHKVARAKFHQIRNFAHALKMGGFDQFNGWPTEGIESLFKRESSRDTDLLIDLLAGSLLTSRNEASFEHGVREQFFAERSACFFHGSHELPYARLTEKLKGLSLLERVDYITSQVFEAVLKHELGHTFGLRHNFKGAYDALNYPPNFWGVDTKDFLMRDGLSQEELRSSSVMDYHKRFNSDFSGLGLYDYAALLSGYAGMVEVFDTRSSDFVPASFINRLHEMNYRDLPYLFAGGTADQVIDGHYHSVRDSYLRGDAGAHMQIDTLGLKERPDNLYRRRLIDYQTLKNSRVNSILGEDAERIYQVPYEFCSDGQTSGYDIACHPFIYGSDAKEIVEYAISDYELMQRLEQLGGDVLPSSLSAYLHYVYNRVYVPILRTYQWMYFTASSEDKITPHGHDLVVGSKIGLDFISRVLQAIEPGEYCKDPQGNYVIKTDDEPCLNPLSFDVGFGKPYKSSFNRELVGKEERIGYIYDKILALLALIDDQPLMSHQFSSLGHQEYSVGFYRLFSPQITRLFAQIYADSFDKWSPSVVMDQDGRPTIKFRDLFLEEDLAQVLDLPKIKPSFSRVLKDYAILFSMAGLSNHLDHKLDFAKRAQINIVQHSSLAEESGSTLSVIFRDPNTGIGYTARHHDNLDFSLGYELLKDARRFIRDGSVESEPAGPWHVAKSSWDRAKAKLAIMRLTEGSSQNDLDTITREIERAKDEFDRKNKMLTEKVHVIEKVRKLSKIFAD